MNAQGHATGNSIGMFLLHCSALPCLNVSWTTIAEDNLKRESYKGALIDGCCLNHAQFLAALCRDQLPANLERSRGEFMVEVASYTVCPAIFDACMDLPACRGSIIAHLTSLPQPTQRLRLLSMDPYKRHRLSRFSLKVFEAIVTDRLMAGMYLESDALLEDMEYVLQGFLDCNYSHAEMEQAWNVINQAG